MKKECLFLTAALMLCAAPVLAAQEEQGSSPGEWQSRLDTFDKDSEDRLTVKTWNTPSDGDAVAVPPDSARKPDEEIPPPPATPGMAPQGHGAALSVPPPEMPDANDSFRAPDRR